MILKDVFEDGHVEVSYQEIVELTDTTLTVRDIEGDGYSATITLHRK